MLLFWRILVATVVLIFHHEKRSVEARAMDKERVDPLQTLSNYNGYAYDFRQGPVGVYSFYYNLPHSSRYEERSESGEVKGNYAYVAPEGNEFKFKYEAGKKGFQVESNALPTAPEDTEEVKRAKQEFFEAYDRALALAELEGYGRKTGASGELQSGESKLIRGFKGGRNRGDYGDHERRARVKEEEEEEEEEEKEGENEDEDEEEEEEEEDEEDDDESSAESSEEVEYYEKDNEESSEESDDEEDEDKDYEESSEEDDDDDDEESSEESSPEDDDEDEDEIRQTLNKRIESGFSRRQSSSYVIPNYIYKNRKDIPTNRRRISRRTFNPRARNLYATPARRFKRTRSS